MHQEGKQRSGAKRTSPLRDGAGRKETRPRPGLGALQVPSDVQLSEEQKTKVEALVAEYRRKIAELRAKLTDILTDEQNQASAVAKKQALAEGKKGVALRRVVDAAAKLTDEQKKQLLDLREAMGKLLRERGEKLLQVLTGTE